MNIERVLQITIAVLAAMATLLLGMGSGSLALPLAAIFAAASSLYVTDRYGWVYLNRNIANLAAVTAVLISIHDFFQLERERQLLAIAYLLIYLQIVLLYQRKTIRIYWQLLMLSLLQVVVAAALNFGLQFGILLAIYMFLALFALRLFFIVREQARCRLAGRAEGLDPKNHCREKGSPEDAGFRVGLAAGVLRQGIATLALTFLAFLLLPRAGDGKIATQTLSPRIVGFTETIRLGDLGMAIENTQPVMRVWLLDAKTQQPFRLVGEPLFRGTVVDRYENGTWSLAGSQNMRNENFSLKNASREMTRQRIKMDPLREPTLFAIYSPAVVEQSTPVAFNPRKQQLLRTTAPNARLEIVLATDGIRFRRQRAIEPLGRFDRVRGEQLLQPFGRAAQERTSRTRLQDLSELATEILRNADLPEADFIGRARALERFLKNSNDFEYRLTAATRDPAVDPIVDFLTENREGHCEYFSSALTLMLRSQGIKARMVIGFSGGEWNALGGYYQVRQKHAHSWTEAFIPPAQLAEMPRGGWLRLDPTPAQAAFSNAAATNVFSRYYQQLRNYGEFLWSSYVIELNAKRQQETIYAPLASSGRLLGKLLSPQFWKEELPGSVAVPPGSGSTAWLLAKTLLLLLAVLLAVCGVVWIFRRITRSRSGGPAEQALQAWHPLVVPFYKHYEKILRRHGLTRTVAQTPQEFATVIANRFANSPELCGLADLPPQIVATYYRICYGGRLLGGEQLAQLGERLHQLAAALKANARQRSGRR